MSLAQARAVADAVLYEGYLLYPYRASSQKNQLRWQFGVLGPPSAQALGVGESPHLAAECLLRTRDTAGVTVHLRFLQLQTREVERIDTSTTTGFAPVPELVVDGGTWLSWDEAVEHEVVLGPFRLADLTEARTLDVAIDPGDEEEPLADTAGRLVGRNRRRRWALRGQVRLTCSDARQFGAGATGLRRLTMSIANVSPVQVTGKDDAIRSSFIGAHALLVAQDATFVSLLDPPDSECATAAAHCVQSRCFPVLAGDVDDRHIVLVSPIILYDHPQLADQSAGALFDSTEIDEILTLRVMTLTDEEKAAARATDPRAAEIIDRCEALTPEALQAMHGVLRDPHALARDDLPAFLDGVPTFGTGDADQGDHLPWWDPGVDAEVSPDTESVIVAGVEVAKNSLVRLHPQRRADAQDLFFDGRTARVTSVLFDVDGGTHVAVVILDDPAADLHDWYGRYLCFDPDEIEPLAAEHHTSSSGKEN